MISRILVSGVSGPIGASLLPSLKTRGFEVTRLVRGAAAGDDQISWNPAKPIAPNMVSGFDAVIHLAGESIVGRWTKTKKIKIRSSRVAGTTTLAEALAAAQDKPQVFVCSSAIGYYGDRGDEVLNEESKPGIGFLADSIWPDCKGGSHRCRNVRSEWMRGRFRRIFWMVFATVTAPPWTARLAVIASGLPS